MWFHERLQGSFDHHLGDEIGNRGYSQRPGSTIVLRYVHPSHRRRKIAARCQPIPQLVEVVFEISLKVRDRLSIHASRTLVGSHAFVGFPDFAMTAPICATSLAIGPSRSCWCGIPLTARCSAVGTANSICVL